MAVITPILDTLLHDVLGKRMDPPNPRQIPEAVRPVHPQDALTALRSDSRLQSGQGPAAVAAGQQQLRTGQTPQHSDVLLNRQPAGQPSQEAGSVRLSFSPVGRIVADLMQRFPDASTVVRSNVPLVDPGAPAQEVAGRLQLSLRESGLFYESHLSRWSRGDYPLSGLQREPQARLAGIPFQATGATPSGQVAGAALQQSSVVAQGQTPGSNTTSQQSAAVAGESAALPAREEVASRPNLVNSDVLQSLVRQQLEMLAAPVLRWEGDVWSGLFMALVVHVPPALQQGREQQEEAGDSDEQEEAEGWHSQLNLQVNGLGTLGVDIRLQAQSLGLTLRGDSTVIDRLKQGTDALLARLETSGLPATTLRFEVLDDE